MKRLLTAATLAAGLATAMATGSLAMGTEIDALMSTLTKELATRGIETEGLENLTITQLRQVAQMLSDGNSAGEMRSQIDTFVNK